jgi:dGTP triphosphohydrolase
MFERVYLGAHTRTQHEQARDVIRRIFDDLAGRGEPPERIVDYVAGMTDRFALTYVADL